ncbi:unnamed protein product [Sphagnum compactum]
MRISKTKSFCPDTPCPSGESCRKKGLGANGRSHARQVLSVTSCLHACTCHECPTLGKHLSLPQWIQELQGGVNAGHDGDEESSQESDSKKAWGEDTGDSKGV